MEQVQKMYQRFQEEMNWSHNDKRDDFQRSKEFLLYTHMLLTTEELKKNGISEDEAYIATKAKIRENLGKELTDCLAYLCKLANFLSLT
ncbi:MazG-like family protein [Bacillus cereus]|uniref:MazG-like family protein n=1 Tax=Bacillus cereus TaxID=1396 RepID=UPI001D0D6992|nr:MazG-like family protein [Bacillus cereus]